ncbi:FAD-dependent oxidoreductase [Lentzea sp. NPDC051208]|uniref:flavin monoamine oxidase family protein n=1 Tax=Lentzea sp. NPDC051208 TaxID=3154642 RepID=UPI003444DD07
MRPDERANGQERTAVVLGAGLAGLCAAHELRRRGVRVVAVIEAQNRIGGRVQTVRDRLRGDQYAEVGATRILDSHVHVLDYVREFGLRLREFQPATKTLFRIRGRTFTRSAGEPWPTDLFDLAEDERSADVESLMQRHGPASAVGNPFCPRWPTPRELDIDSRPFLEHLRERQVSDDALLLLRTVSGSALDSAGTLFWLRALMVDDTHDHLYAVHGGNDQLTDALARGLGDVLRLNSPVLAVDQSTKSAVVTYRSSGRAHTVTADFVVCALPPHPMRRITWGRSLSTEKAEALRTVKMMPAARCYLQTSTRFWTEHGLDGLTLCCTDTPLERVWDMTHVQDGNEGLLLAYMEQDNALAFSHVPHAQRLSYVREQLSTVLPDVERHLVGGFHKSWHEDPWAGGGWTHVEAGQMATVLPAVRHREGRVLFCGEHTSPWGGWMQGALESAHRVVRELLSS